MVYDVGEFAPRHPGGRIIESFRGKDASSGACFMHAHLLQKSKILFFKTKFFTEHRYLLLAFGGAVYAHSRAARNLLHTMLVGRLASTRIDDNAKSTALRDMAADDAAVTAAAAAAAASSSSSSGNVEVDAVDDHGLLAHVSVARPQLIAIKESAYEIDFPIE